MDSTAPPEQNEPSLNITPNVLRIEDSPACGICGSVDPTHPLLTCWQKRIEELGSRDWELGVSPLTPPFNRHPILSLRRGSDDIVEEILQASLVRNLHLNVRETPLLFTEASIHNKDLRLKLTEYLFERL